MRKRFQITEYCQNFMKDYIGEGDLCIDATAGNGGDTEFLCRMIGERAVLIRVGHERMAYYVKEEVAAIMFNFGYLPGADHAVATKAETSLAAIRCGMELLKVGGVMSLCIYSGGDTGYEERTALLGFLKTLDPKRWLVLVHEFYNRKNDPPLPVFLVKLS